MEDIIRTITALTSLIEVNNRRAKLYQSLAERTQHGELRSLFNHYSEQSKHFSSELSAWRSAYGGFSMAEKKRSRGFRAQLTSLLERWHRKNVASTCEEVEQDAYKVYRATMELSFLPAAAAADIDRQSKEFQKALAKLRGLRGQFGSNASILEESVRMPAF